MPIREIKHEVQGADEGRVDLLIARLTQVSRANVRGLIDCGAVQLNSALCEDAGARVQAGDRITLRYEPGRRYREKPKVRETRGFTVVYRDDDLVVVNKDAGLLTVPTENRETKSLVTLLSTHINGPRSRPLSLVHRLDRETSGLLVFGRRPEIANALIRQFSDRKPEREYLTLVAGRLDQDKGTIRSLLRTDKSLNQKSAQGGEEAITHFEVVERFSTATLLRVRLETGRRNQIRVHCAEMGHPVLGDQRYATDRAQHRDWPYKRLALHARLLGFTHPLTSRAMRFEQELPREFTQFLQRSRRN